MSAERQAYCQRMGNKSHGLWGFKPQFLLNSISNQFHWRQWSLFCLDSEMTTREVSYRVLPFAAHT